MTDDRVDQLLAAADPVAVDGLSSDAVRGALDALRQEIRDVDHAPSPARRRTAGRRRLFVAVAAVAVAGSATAAAAAGGLFSAHTGREAPGGENGTGEVLRLDAPDAGDVLRELGADIPLPPGASFDAIEERLPDEATEQATSGARGFLEWNAACMWGTYWLDAQASGDAAAIEAAQEGIDRLPSRPDLVGRSDPADASRTFWEAFAAAARSGDVSAFRAAGYDANCTDARPGT